MKYPRWRRRPDGGAALVEFALVLPIFALMLFAMIQFGVLFAGWAQLRNAVQTGARMASVGQQSPECGPLSPPACTVAVLVGSPTGLTSPSEVITSLSDIPNGAHCNMGTASNANLTCNDASWLDGYYIYLNGAWEQIVSAAAPSPGQIVDRAALKSASEEWTCAPTSDCTVLETNVGGTSNLALGGDYDNIAVVCRATCDANANGQVLVCARLAVTPFTGLLPKFSVSTESTFYIETGNATTMNQGGIPCG